MSELKTWSQWREWLGYRFRVAQDAPSYNQFSSVLGDMAETIETAVRASDARIAELEAERPRAGQKVRPLEWFMPHGAETMLIAETVLGKYRVWTHSEAGGRWFSDVSTLGAVSATIESGNTHSCTSAKAAAQADYEARILSALVQP